MGIIQKYFKFKVVEFDHFKFKNGVKKGNAINPKTIQFSPQPPHTSDK